MSWSDCGGAVPERCLTAQTAQHFADRNAIVELRTSGCCLSQDFRKSAVGGAGD